MATNTPLYITQGEVCVFKYYYYVISHYLVTTNFGLVYIKCFRLKTEQFLQIVFRICSVYTEMQVEGDNCIHSVTLESELTTRCVRKKRCYPSEDI